MDDKRRLPAPEALASTREKLASVASSIEAEASDDARSIVVRCKPGGVVSDIAFTARAFRTDGHDLSERIMGLVREARSLADRELAETAAAVFENEGI
ncbi:hypothetical protein [Haloglycomyces albus]|uniref:hypothetical protein n=1 Tax=Haloglycomyces albus TaxID=526067 RepID=UPI00046D87E2|nr:hypothetical protein [Haloglycomyces albus]